MMLIGPILIALIPVVIILELTRWLSKKEFPFWIIITPGIVSIMVAINLFYSGFVNLRGFVGLSYGILALFLIMTGFKSLFIGKNIGYDGYI
ncbi:preprotein translocase subunit SecD/SecF [Lysinibacillus contaminans]|uniref:Preprotein translocase subunit SecD/SecF n=1 Tax=Lysinibacillus contaminans TaxID=1293441 RepID=A0ABR5K1H6_9BACI|nr:hypothetical protein [Lysinibacillus contaminans]KOS68751.1 preprotein translocase subunit SecD/SecF [Lysinibacillus contaminans]